MLTEVPLLPEQASTVAPAVDRLFWFLTSVSVFFGVLIAALLIGFAIRFRRRPGDGIPPPPPHAVALEVAWSLIPLAISMIVFVWAASLYFRLSRPPDDTMDVLVTGKRWMWKLQHLNGRREVNELHVPVHRAVKLTMTSEDVIHSFFIPAFRIKADVFPGRYSSTWFQATKTGRFHLFCTEYCGAKHSEMGGWVTVMDPAEFEAWLSGETAHASPASAGEKLFSSLGCVTCHRKDSQGRGPVLDGVYGKTVALAGGGSVLADEDYLRESIVNPAAKVVAGYASLMPTFRGLVSEPGLLELIEYMKSLGPEGGSRPVAPADDSVAPPPVPAPAPRSAPIPAPTPAAVSGPKPAHDGGIR